MKILFAVNSNGLGHTTRCIPLIRSLIKDHDIYIMASFRSLDFLKNEFKHKVKKYFDVPDYSFQNRAFLASKFSISKFLINVPLYLNEVRRENTRFKRLHKRYQFDRIISDSRIGVFDKNVPSFLIDNHIRITVPKIGIISEDLTELTTYLATKYFKKILIPDFKENSISGNLTHNFRYLSDKKIEYLGILSMTKKERVKSDIDYFFSISGPEPQRTQFQKLVYKKIKTIKDKKIVITLGKPEKEYYKKKGNVEIFGFLNNKKQSEIMNRSKLIIARSGLSTLSDICELGKKALFVPTKGQPEQEYLAKFHHDKNHFLHRTIDEFNIPKDLNDAMKFDGYKKEHNTDESIKKFLDVVL